MRTALLASLVAASILVPAVASSHDLFYALAFPRPGNPGGQWGLAGLLGPDCGVGNHILLNLSIGGVCFGATAADGWDNGNGNNTDFLGRPLGSTASQHLTPASPKQSSVITIHDLLFFEVLGTYCQDLNDDGACGANLTGAPETEAGGNPSPLCQGVHPEGLAGCEFRSEPLVDFCGSIEIFGGLTGPLPAGSRRKPGFAGGPLPGDWADPDLENWAIDFDVLIFPSAPLKGNFILGDGSCTAAFSLFGWVSHSGP